MEPTTFFSGILSGLDFRALVDAIIEAESRPITKLEEAIAKVEARSSALVSFEGFLNGLRDSSKALSDNSMFGARMVTTVGAAGLVSATASNGAELGSHQVRVLQQATSERLSGDAFDSNQNELGLSGEFLMGGRRVSISATDSLEEVATAINQANVGSNASGVQASVLSISATEHRLILTAENTGSDGIDLVDGADGVLRSLGVLDATTSVKQFTTDGALSDGFANSTQTISTVLGLTSAPPPSDVTFGTFDVTIDLSTMSLTDIANEINTEAASAGSSVTAAVVQDTSGGTTKYRLDVSATTSFTDAGGVLELLGVLEGGRSDVVQELKTSNTLTIKNTSNPATTNTKLKDLGINGTDAGIDDGDTLDVSGTYGDGSTFSFTYTLDDGDKFSKVLDRINDATDGLQAGGRTATASLDANGNIIVTDDQGGESQLSLTIRANNENGGTLDFGTFDVSQDGYRRVIAAGIDAQLEVDGVYLERSSNSVTDAVPGLTLNLDGADPNQLTTVTVGRDDQAVTEAITAFVDAYNAAAGFISEAIAAPEEGEERGPLSGDSTLRGMQTKLRDAMRDVLAPGIAGNLTRLLDIGIELQQDGTFALDSAKLQAAMDVDPTSVQRLFGLYGAGSISELQYVGATSETEVGDYAVDITQAATRALLTGIGFSGTYSDDGNADTMTVRDVQTGGVYSISLEDNDTLQMILAKLNTELQTGLQEIHVAANALHSDGVGTAATSATLLQDVFNSGGASAGILTGDTFTISGTTRGGATYSADMTIIDAATQTVGDLIQALQTQLGVDTDVSIDANGVITATDKATGSSLLTVSLASDNLGGGTFDLGGVAAQQEGRGSSALTAIDNGGQIEIQAAGYGLAHGFEISYVAGGSDNTSDLGLAAGTYTGLDVIGTIGGFAATGTGQALTADLGSAAEGLSITYSGLTTGTVGTFSFSRGMGSLVELAADAILDGDFGSISQITERAGERVTQMEERIDVIQGRLDRRETMLLRRFIAAEQAMAQANAQFEFLFNSLPNAGGLRAQ